MVRAVARTPTSLAAAVRERGPFRFLLLILGVLGFQSIAFLIPPIDWLPEPVEVNSFIRALWQVHATVLGLAVIVASIIVTVIANETDRSRTWQLYSEETHFLDIIWFNLILVLGLGLAFLQSQHANKALLDTGRAVNLTVTDSILFVAAIVWLARLFKVTLGFLDDEYVEDLAERRIHKAIPETVDSEIQRLQSLISRLHEGQDGGP